jgi:hypothetical protein
MGRIADGEIAKAKDELLSAGDGAKLPFREG